MSETITVISNRTHKVKHKVEKSNFTIMKKHNEQTQCDVRGKEKERDGKRLKRYFVF